MTAHKVFIEDNKHLKSLEDEVIHLTITSPPYVTTEFKKGQEFDYDGFLSLFQRTCQELYRVTVPGGRFALNIADIITKYRYNDNYMARAPLGSDAFQMAQNAGWKLLERFIWDKGYTRNFGGPLLGRDAAASRHGCVILSSRTLHSWFGPCRSRWERCESGNRCCGDVSRYLSAASCGGV